MHFSDFFGIACFKSLKDEAEKILEKTIVVHVFLIFPFTRSHNTPMNRVVPTYKHQEAVFENNKKVEERRQQSPQPIVQDLLHLKESNAQLPESKLESSEITEVTQSEHRKEFEDAFTPRKYVSQPAFKVKNSEPSPQFYYQPQSVQKEYVYHVQKDEPIYVQNQTFVPVVKPHTEVQQVILKLKLTFRR